MAAGSRDAIGEFAAHVARTRFSDIPASAIEKAKLFILDSLGVGVVGSAGPGTDQLVACARDWGAADDAIVWCRGTRLPAPSAAMVNAYQVHNTEFDAVHEGAVVHPMASILAALLAHAGRRPGISGRELLLALVLGVDVSCSIGLGATTGLRFFRPATAGAFGAAAALGKVEGFDAARLVNAFGLLLGQISGTMQAHVEGSMLLGMQLGFCTRAAVMAHDMAARGLADVVAGLGTAWRVAELSQKPFPSGRATHGVVDALLTLKRRHGFAPDQVERVTATVTPLVFQLTGRPHIDDAPANYARLCIGYVGAVALTRGGVDVSDFGPHRLADAGVHALARRFDVLADDTADPNALAPVSVGVRLADGSEYAIAIDAALGHPSKPLTRQAHLDKFRRNWRGGAKPLADDNRARLEALIDGLEEVPDCAEIVRLLTA